MPDGTKLAVMFVPTETVLPGLSDEIVSVRADEAADVDVTTAALPPTLIGCHTFADTPPALACTISVCSPRSLEAGVQLKRPVESIFAFVAVEIGSVSVSEKL